MNSQSLLPYCVFLPATFELPSVGVQGHEVRRLDADGVSLIYSESDSAELHGDNLQAAALEFHQVLHSIFTHAAIVPFRFPTFLNESELNGHLTARADEYRSFLQDHANQVQMEVRVMPAHSSAVQTMSGAEFMKKKAAVRQRLLTAADRIAEVKNVVNWSTREVRDSIRLFALVEREQMNAFGDAISSLVLDEVKLRVSGPWPATEFFAQSERRSAGNVVSISRGERS